MGILFLALPWVVDQVTDTCSPVSASLMYLWELRLEDTITQRTHATWWRLPELQGPLVLVTCPPGVTFCSPLLLIFVCVFFCMLSKCNFLELVALLSHMLSPGVRELIHMLSPCCAPRPPNSSRFSVQSEYLSYADLGTSHTFAQSGHCPSQGGHCYCSLWLVPPGVGHCTQQNEHYKVAFRDLKHDMVPTEPITALEKISDPVFLCQGDPLLVPLSLLTLFLG